MQKTLQPGTPLALANAIEMVGECSQCTTSHLAMMATPVNQSTNFVTPNTATSQTPISPELMHCTVAIANT